MLALSVLLGLLYRRVVVAKATGVIERCGTSLHLGWVVVASAVQLALTASLSPVTSWVVLLFCLSGLAFASFANRDFALLGVLIWTVISIGELR